MSDGGKCGSRACGRMKSGKRALRERLAKVEEFRIGRGAGAGLILERGFLKDVLECVREHCDEEIQHEHHLEADGWDVGEHRAVSSEQGAGSREQGARTVSRERW